MPAGDLTQDPVGAGAEAVPARTGTGWEPFAAALRRHGVSLRRGRVETLQVNVGRLCNQTCAHCHVEAGPARREIMPPAVIDEVLRVLALPDAPRTLDITGGAPEMNPDFRRLVTGARRLGVEVIDRCNLTVLFIPGQEDTAAFLAAHQVRVVASMPCYLKDNVERQRGRGVYDQSIEGLRRLNALGYARSGTGLYLDLVYNPLGPDLPPPQAELEADYRSELRERFGIGFNRLYVMTNLPLKRFARDLERRGRLDGYMRLLNDNFSRSAAGGVMCRSLLSVGWDGGLFDCDFNQMAEMPDGGGVGRIAGLSDWGRLPGATIAVADHCYGCTAGQGSSCSGATI